MLSSIHLIEILKFAGLLARGHHLIMTGLNIFKCYERKKALTAVDLIRHMSVAGKDFGELVIRCVLLKLP